MCSALGLSIIALNIVSLSLFVGWQLLVWHRSALLALWLFKLLSIFPALALGLVILFYCSLLLDLTAMHLNFPKFDELGTGKWVGAEAIQFENFTQGR